MSPNKLDLDAYFERIGYTDTPVANFACLKRIHRLHEENIPFENLDVLFGQPISIELPDIFQKLVTHKRGGYCFEQNSLFAAVLRQLGFQVAPFLARVLWMEPEDTMTPLSHLVLCVETEAGPHLADVGFGGVGLVEPIALESDEVQHLDFEPRRIVSRDSHLVHQIKLGEDWKDVYQFVPKTVPPIDLEIGNWYSSTHPKAHFLNTLLVTKIVPDGRIVVSDTEFVERDWHGQVKRTEIESRAKLHQILDTKFDLQIPANAQIPLSFKP